MFEVHQISETEWEILDAAGNRVGATHATYELAVAFVGGMLAFADQAAAMDGPATADGLLPEGWVGDPAICFAQDTGDGRDFTGCVWTSRAPDVSTMPLMLQTETEFGHIGAQLAGFITAVSNLGAGTNPSAEGRFYDTETGRAARDLLLDGRSFGVSVDPGAVDVDWECVEEDEDGFCVDFRAEFLAYEVIGLTLTPFPAFAEAAIRLDTPAVAAAASITRQGVTLTYPSPLTLNTATHSTVGLIVATAAGPATRTPLSSIVDLLRPPAGWFATAEPQFGEPFALGSLGDEWLVDQGDGRLAMPLTITDDGRVAGHGAVWGQEHTGWPGRRVTPPTSETAYAHYHVGEVHTAEGERVAVGALCATAEHAITELRAPGARDTYAHNSVAWANVRASNGEHGVWLSGALRHDVTAEQLAVLRAGALSGDWRRIGGNLELIAMLAVTTPGFPIAREAITASGLQMPATPAVAASMRDGEQISLVASGIVRRCPDCVRRAQEAARQDGAETQRPDPQSARIERTLALLERRTRHLVGPAAEHAATHIRRTT